MGQLMFVCGVSLIAVGVIGAFMKMKWSDINEKGFLACGYIGVALTIFGAATR